MFRRSKFALIALAVALPIAVPSTVAVAQSGPPQGCVGAETADWPAANFAYDWAGHLAATMVSKVGVGLPHSRSVAVAGIPAGTYGIDTVSYDGSPNRNTDPPQPQEQFVIDFLDATDSVIATTGASADLADSVLEASWAGSLGEVVLDRVAVTVRARHVIIGDTPTANSVMPVCVGWSLVQPTTTTTTTTEPPTVDTSTTTTTEPPTVDTSTTTTTTTIPTQVLPEVETSPDPDPVTATPTFTG